MREPVSAWPFAKKWLSGTAVAYGWNLSSDKAQHFSSLSHPKAEAGPFEARGEQAIVIVEDNAGDVLLMREALREHGIPNELVVLTDGERGMAFIDALEAESAPRTRRPALVILDLNLPKCNGFDLLERMRQTKACADIPVMIFSSSDSEADRRRARALGASRYVCKPVGLEPFLAIGAVVRELLS